MNGYAWLAASAITLGLGAAVIAYGPDLLPKQNPTDAAPTFAAQRGPLTISITESGTIQAREQVLLKNEVEGRTTIITLKEEGRSVKKGELLIELDASALEDQRIEGEIKVQNAEASMIGAREGLEVAKSQARSDIAQAELDNRFAKEDLQNYIDGEYPRSLKEAESKITLALEELENANETLRWSEKLFAEKYISQTELDRDRLAQSRASLDHELAVSALGLLKEYTHRRQLDELNSAVDQAEMALERVQRKAKSEVVQAEANLRAKEAEHERLVSQLERTRQQISKTKIYAPIDGMVVHATTGKGGFRGNDEPLKEGKEIREREELIYLPVANSMMAKINVHESALDKINVGQRVQITLEALPGRTFPGVVSRIAPLPDAQSVWMNPDLKVYPTEINLDGELSELRTGMSCQAEILVENIADAIYVPLQSVVRVGSQPRVYLLKGGQFVPQDVEIGLDNRHVVNVKSGLAEGDVVMLAPPLEQGARRMNSSGDGFGTNADVAGAAVMPTGDAPMADPGMGMHGGAEGEDGAGRGGRGAGRGGRGGGGGGRSKPTAEQMEEFKKRMEGMTPEEREKMRGRPSPDAGSPTEETR